MSLNVKFYKQKNIEKEKTVLEIADKLDIKIKASCHGKGKCGKCKVRITEGTVSEPTKSEKNILGDKKIKDNIRLACETKVLGDVEIELLD